MPSPRSSVARRLFVRIAIGMVAVFVGLGAAAIAVDFQARLRDLESRAETVTRLVAVSAIDALRQGTRLALRDVEGVVAAYPEVTHSVVFDPEGDVIVAQGVPFITDAGAGFIVGGPDELHTRRIAVGDGGSRLRRGDGVVEVIEVLPGGETLVVGFTTALVEDGARRAGGFIVIALALALALVSIVTWLSVRYFIAQPVVTITDGANAIAQGNLDVRLAIPSSMELAILAEDFNKMAEELERARRAQRRFFSSITHELRSPVNAIKGFVDLVLATESQLSPKGRENLARVQRSAERQLALVNDILDLSKLEAARLEVTIGEVALAPLVDDVCAHARALAAGRAVIEVRGKLEPRDLTIETDEGRLRQILVNLAANAVRFTPSGQVRIEALADGPDHVTLVVEDEGIGIPEKDRPFIFDAFRQAEGHDHAGGSGLGLAIVKQLTELLEGSITFTSEQHQGTCFTVRLPRRHRATSGVA